MLWGIIIRNIKKVCKERVQIHIVRNKGKENEKIWGYGEMPTINNFNNEEVIQDILYILLEKTETRVQYAYDNTMPLSTEI